MRRIVVVACYAENTKHTHAQEAFATHCFFLSTVCQAEARDHNRICVYCVASVLWCAVYGFMAVVVVCSSPF